MLQYFRITPFTLSIALGILCLPFSATGQSSKEVSDEDAFFIKKIYNTALTQPIAHEWLDHLCNSIGGRLAGSSGAAAAVEYTYQMLDTLGLTSVSRQACEVPHWERGEKEIVKIINSPSQGDLNLKALALGNSIGTGPKGITAEVIEVQTLDQLEDLGTQAIRGKIVFFNRPMDPTQIRTFNAYGGAVDQRVYGASRASKYGAVACLVRSLTTRTDDFPHTGVQVYEENVRKIPSLSISTIAANKLSQMIANEPTEVFIKNNSRMLAPKSSHNVIGEWKGSNHAEEIILVGGHLDSWDVGQGAHDDGAGCVQAMDALRILKAVGYTPQRTLRTVLFMNEENGLGGGLEYAKVSNEKKEFHLAAIESDAGGFSPRGFSCTAEDEVFTKRFKKLLESFSLLESYGLYLEKGGAGADINPLKSQKGLLVGLRPDSQRYFDYHHTEIDTFDKVNQRELQLGAAAMASLIYLIDKYGL